MTHRYLSKNREEYSALEHLEAKYFRFRAGLFNFFNKIEFVNPNGNLSNTTGGQMLQARDPRLVQLALKFYL
jgi:hypothetical protein